MAWEYYDHRFGPCFHREIVPPHSPAHHSSFFCAIPRKCWWVYRLVWSGKVVHRFHYGSSCSFVISQAFYFCGTLEKQSGYVSSQHSDLGGKGKELTSGQVRALLSRPIWSNATTQLPNQKGMKSQIADSTWDRFAFRTREALPADCVWSIRSGRRLHKNWQFLHLYAIASFVFTHFCARSITPNLFQKRI